MWRSKTGPRRDAFEHGTHQNIISFETVVFSAKIVRRQGWCFIRADGSFCLEYLALAIRCDVINMSYGEPVQTPVGGRFGEIIKEFVNKHGVHTTIVNVVLIPSLHVHPHNDAFHDGNFFR